MPRSVVQRLRLSTTFIQARQLYLTEPEPTTSGCVYSYKRSESNYIALGYGQSTGTLYSAPVNPQYVADAKAELLYGAQLRVEM